MRYTTQQENVKTNSQDYQMIQDMIQYSKANHKFDPTYLESIMRFGQENGYITAKQYNSLFKIYRSFRMHTIKKIE